jgi:hypothetical protein
MIVKDLLADQPGGWIATDAVRRDDVDQWWLNLNATVCEVQEAGVCVQVVLRNVVDAGYKMSLDKCGPHTWERQPSPISPEWVKVEPKSAW